MKRDGPSLELLEILVQDELNKKWDIVINADMNRITDIALNQIKSQKK